MFNEAISSVQVFVRVQPPQVTHLTLLHNQSLQCGSKWFTFDHIFPTNTTQTEIFNKLGTKIVSNAKKGYNSCIFAYGQTGSGKTYTMTGNHENAGLIQKCMESLWEVLQGCENFQININYYEVYNQQINDLLLIKKNKKLPIKLKESITLGFYLENITEVKVQNKEDLYLYLEKGLSNRITAETKMNAQSSRSHSILTLKIQMKEKASNSGSFSIKSSKIHFVDLAGSEKQRMTEACGERLKQASNINKSLTSLSMVIEKLSTKATHIPYRDSVLTKILKDSLGGNSKTILIATISSKESAFSQTLSTLNFAAKAKKIHLSVKVNQQIEGRVNLDQMKNYIAKLEEQLKVMKQRQFFCADCQQLKREFAELETKNQSLEKQLAEADQKIKQFLGYPAENDDKTCIPETSILSKNRESADIRDIQIRDMEIENLKKKLNFHQMYQQYYQDFMKYAKKLKMSQAQQVLFFAQFQRIKQLNSELESEKLENRKKIQYFEAKLQDAQIIQQKVFAASQHFSQRTVLTQPESHVSNQFKMGEENKRLRETLESIQILRQQEKKQIEDMKSQIQELLSNLEAKEQIERFQKESHQRHIEDLKIQFSKEIEKFQAERKRFQMIEKSQQERIQEIMSKYGTEKVNYEFLYQEKNRAICELTQSLEDERRKSVSNIQQKEGILNTFYKINKQNERLKCQNEELERQLQKSKKEIDSFRDLCTKNESSSINKSHHLRKQLSSLEQENNTLKINLQKMQKEHTSEMNKKNEQIQVYENRWGKSRDMYSKRKSRWDRDRKD